MKNWPITTFFLILIATSFYETKLHACSRLAWSPDENLHIVGRSFDWSSSLKELLYIFPRGQKLDGGEGPKSYKWTSKYASVVSSIASFLKENGDFDWNDGAIDGINEQGLAAHALFLPESIFSTKQDSRPIVGTFRWVRFILDNYSSVEDAIEGMKTIHLVPSKLAGNLMLFHLAIEDSRGDSAIIEFIDGKMIIKHGKQFKVLTNNPVYDKQIENLKNYQSFGGQTPLPGNVNSLDRFVRLSYFEKFLPKTSSPIQALTSVKSSMRSVASPFGAPYGPNETYPSWWISISDLSNLTYYFESFEALHSLTIELKKTDLSKGSGIRWLNPREPKSAGVASDKFSPLAELMNKPHL